METPVVAQPESFAFVESLAADLSSGSLELPSFPEVVVRIRQALGDENCTTDKLSQLLSSEPALAARLLQIANSAALRRGPEPVSDITTAVNRLGREIVRNSAMSFAMKQIREGQKLQAAQTHLKIVWNEGVTVAALCFVLAKRFTKINPDQALLVGLLHGIGKLYILAKAEDHPELFHDEEVLYDLLQEWHPGIGCAILESLEFGDAIASAVGNYQDVTREHDGDVDFTDLLMIAHLVSGLLNEEQDFELQLDGIPASRYFTTSAEDFFAVLQESAEHITSLKQALGD